MGIILLLSGLSIVGGYLGKSKVHSAQCMTNMKQVGLAIKYYMQDYDEVLPPLVQRPLERRNSYTSQDVTWRHGIKPYMKGDVACPELELPNKIIPVFYRWGMGMNMEANHRIREDFTGGFRVWFTPKSFSQVAQVSSTILVGDCSYYLISINTSIRRGSEVIPSSTHLLAIDLVNNSNNSNHVRRHSGGGNYIMMDGSGTWIHENSLVEEPGSKYRFSIP